MKFKIVEDILTEHYINLFEKSEKEKYVQKVYDMIQDSYAYIGGAKGISIEELMEPDVFFKLDTANGHIRAGAVYVIKNKIQGFAQPNRKMKYMFSDGTSEGKHRLMMIVDEDISKMPRHFWAEVSGKPEQIFLNRGAVAIPNYIAADVLKKLDKKLISLNDDGYHYTRKIGGVDCEKMIVANNSTVDDHYLIK